MVKLAINGAMGRMGKMIAEAIEKTPDAEVSRLIDSENFPDIADKTGLSTIDAVIDFSLPDSTLEMLEVCVAENKPIVIGTTGLTAEQIIKVEEAATKIPVVYASNMSVSVNLFFKILKEVVNTLKGYDINMCEGHHIHKKDAPSGTAKTLVDIINQAGNNVKYEDVDVIRQGEIIGDHAVVFDSPLDSFEIKHHAKTRAIFADGAVKAGIWLAAKAPGLYNMQDVLF